MLFIWFIVVDSNLMFIHIHINDGGESYYILQHNFTVIETLCMIFDGILFLLLYRDGRLSSRDWTCGCILIDTVLFRLYFYMAPSYSLCITRNELLSRFTQFLWYLPDLCSEACVFLNNLFSALSNFISSRLALSMIFPDIPVVFLVVVILRTHVKIKRKPQTEKFIWNAIRNLFLFCLSIAKVEWCYLAWISLFR